MQQCDASGVVVNKFSAGALKIEKEKEENIYIHISSPQTLYFSFSLSGLHKMLLCNDL